MAVKACSTKTLFQNIDIIGTTYYYKLVNTLTTPNVPADSVVDPTTSAGGSWSISEPSYTEGSTSYLYYTIQTKFSNGTQSYSYSSIVNNERKACLSSSYEAAKAAYNKAVNAQSTANTANTNATNITNRVNDKENHFNFKYYTDVRVYGDVDKFYPVIIKAGDQNVKRTILVKRGYNESAPAEWNKSTHPGALTLKILCNFGGWGGATYSWEISEFQEQYSNIFGGASNCGNNCMFAIFLRGGGTNGAIYHLYSDQSLTANINNYGWDSSISKYRANMLPAPQISYRTDYVQYKSDLCFGAPGNKTQNPAGSGYYDDLQYKVDAPAPRAMVANGTTEGGFTKYVRTSAQNEEIRIRNYVSLAQATDTTATNALSKANNVDSSLDETNQNVADLGGRTSALETDIDNKVDNDVFDDYKEYVTTHYTTISQTDDKISFSINQATQSLVTKTEYSTTTTKLAEVRSYFDFDQEGLTIGKSTSNTTLLLSNDKLSFKLNGNEKAYMSPNSFVLKELNTFKLGGFAFKVRANGNLALVWVGEDE